MSFIMLLAGFVLLVWGADRFVIGSSSLAKKLGMPPFIIGLTIVAFGTSAPELAVSVTASINKANEIALGNILGSNIFNLSVVAGMSAIIIPLIVEKNLLNRDWLASILATLVVLIMLIDNTVSRFDAILLLASFVIILFLQITAAKKQKIPVFATDNTVKEKNSKIIGNIIVGLVCIIVGGQCAVSGATDIAFLLGLSETLIGLTVIAIGTSLPELVTSLVATKRGETSIAIANVIGSNLFNILFILGISCLVNPISVTQNTFYDTLLLFIITLGMFLLAKRQKLNRLWGVLLCGIYVTYTAWLIIR